MKELVPFLNSTVNKDLRPLSFCDSGYANGYVAVPPEHPLFGKHYDKVDDMIDINSSLTFSDTSDSCCNWDDIETINDNSNTIPLGWWVFGFDTIHLGYTLKTWPKERCIEETLRLKEQLEELWNR